ncbi:hypothetical protein Ahy_A09g045849 [Arachis hypogaea]|uniref:Uncharacterized protein n=1 Tax=Arachis hypogaea TaxID=3818 RepID=A0A445BNA2_ARAHY|nr:hypothetical protein Ahy_A09g045849 [Arachis hypogaea]
MEMSPQGLRLMEDSLGADPCIKLFARANLILFPRIPDEETLGEPPTPTTVHSLSVACFGPLSHYLEKVSHWFRYKKLSLPPGQLDIQPVIATTQLRQSLLRVLLTLLGRSLLSVMDESFQLPLLPFPAGIAFIH